MITFVKVYDKTTTLQKGAIWDWCLDHVKEFGAVPLEYTECDGDSDMEVSFDYDQMLSALSEKQIRILDELIDKHEQS